uniref:Uncharacterized protein n=1 Tax=Molossus molossus TaxID=27622 RepID=A0A7J8JWW7_MOLMO|nr:hypothetical protein HJG59_007855 [Molossus molossus]
MFFHTVNVGAAASWQEQRQLIQDYVKNTVASKTRSQCGVPFYPSITLHKWQEGIGNRLVVIGESGLPLPHCWSRRCCLSSRCPPCGAPSTATTRSTHTQAARGLGRRPSTPSQCGRRLLRWGSSSQLQLWRHLPGVQGVSGKDADGLCQAYRIPNPLTGNASCPANYKASVLHSKLKIPSKTHPECQPQCQRCCQPQCAIREQRSAVRLARAQPSLPAAAGFLAGGL